MSFSSFSSSSISSIEELLGDSKDSKSMGIEEAMKALESIIISDTDTRLLNLAGKNVFDENAAAAKVAAMASTPDGVLCIKFIIASYVKSGPKIDEFDKMKLPKVYEYISVKHEIKSGRGQPPNVLTPSRIVAVLPKLAIKFRIMYARPSAGVVFPGGASTRRVDNPVFCSPEGACLILPSAQNLWEAWIHWAKMHHDVINSQNTKRGSAVQFLPTIHDARRATRFIPLDVKMSWTVYFYDLTGLTPSEVTIAEITSLKASLRGNSNNYARQGFIMPVVSGKVVGTA